MVIEYVENGQVMYYDPLTHTFSNRITRIFVSLLSLVDGVLTEAMAKKYLYDIVSGLQYRCIDQTYSSLVHIHKVVHRDIKPENILISKDDHCKISNSIHLIVLNDYIVDFGVAHIFDTLNSEEGSSNGKERSLTCFYLL